MRVLARKTYAKARMEEIASEAGLSIGGLYWYYKSKDQLVAEMLQMTFSEGPERTRRLLEGDGAAASRIEQFVDIVLDLYRKLAPYPGLAFEYQAFALENREVRRGLLENAQAHRDVLRSLVQTGIDKGEFRSVDPVQAGEAIWNLYDGATSRWIMDPENVDVSESFRSGVRLLLEGMRHGR